MVLNNNSFQDVTNSVGIGWSRQRGDEAFSIGDNLSIIDICQGDLSIWRKEKILGIFL